jgi:hypothetical protein
VTQLDQFIRAIGFGGLFLAKSNWRDLKMERPCAVSWLSLARQDEAMDNLLASWDTPEFVKTDGPGAYSRSTKLCFTEPAYRPALREKAVRRRSAQSDEGTLDLAKMLC